MPRYPAKQGVSEAKLVFARETTNAYADLKISGGECHSFVNRQFPTSYFWVWVKSELPGTCTFGNRKNSSEARFADATTIDERQAGLSLL